MSKISELKRQIMEFEKMLEIAEKIYEDDKKNCPFEDGDDYWMIYHDGVIVGSEWESMPSEYDAFILGNTFECPMEAEFERDKRTFLRRFNNFRDECHGAWEPNWFDENEVKYYIYYIPQKKRFFVGETVKGTAFTQLGYFKNKEDCLKAINNFSDEIRHFLTKELPF